VRLERGALVVVERIQRVRRCRFDQFLVRHARFTTWSSSNGARSSRPPARRSTADGSVRPRFTRSLVPI
jgi:hypothetical protein